MTLPVPESGLRFFRLLRQPGLQMHGDWWLRLGLQDWQDKYTQLSPGSRRELDRLICRRRGYPVSQGNAISSEFTLMQEALLRAESRMPMLLLAMGLLLLECPDYLLWRPYRKVLSSWLSETQIERLQVLWRNGQKTPQIKPEQLVLSAQNRAQVALELVLREDPVWQALRYTLPVVDTPHSAALPTTSAEKMFMRLERFL